MVVTQVVAGAWPPPHTWQGCSTISCILHTIVPYFYYPTQQEDAAVTTQRRRTGFQTSFERAIYKRNRERAEDGSHRGTYLCD